MKRLFAGLAALPLVSLLLAAGTAGAAPGQDRVTGTGAVEDGPILVKLHVNAKSGPFGQDASGHLTFKGNPPPFPEIDFHGRVTCLFVSGNRAVVGFVVTKSKAGPFPEGFPGQFAITDNGEPGRGDLFEGFPGFPPAPCLPSLVATRTMTKGNLTVHDAP